MFRNLLFLVFKNLIKYDIILSIILLKINKAIPHRKGKTAFENVFNRAIIIKEAKWIVYIS